MSADLQTDPLAEAIREYNKSRVCADRGTFCHAPENSMFFARDGAVLACCYSRHAPIGRYPEQTLDEIWNGARIQSMRAALRRNELPEGCDLCAEELLAHNFKGLFAASYDYIARPAKPQGFVFKLRDLFSPRPERTFPTKLEFELSNTCNLECAMCTGDFSSTIRAKREKLPPLPQVYDSKFVDQLEPYLPHLKNANFVGGEPFLIDIYYDIWERLSAVNPACNISITTNGTVYNTKVKRVLESLNCFITISLDSIVKPTYESIRVNAKMERTLANVQQFFEYNKRHGKHASIAVCPMVSNCREMPDLVAFANQHGAKVTFNNVVFPFDHSLQALPEDVAAEVIQLYRSANPAPRTEIEAENQAGLEDVANQVEYWIESRTRQSRNEAAERRRFIEVARQMPLANDPSSCISELIADLEREASGQLPDAPATESEDSSATASAYYGALLELGAALVKHGELPGACFDLEKTRPFLRYLETNLSAEQSGSILRTLKQTPAVVLKYSGAATVEELITTTQSFLNQSISDQANSDQANSDPSIPDRSIPTR